MSNVDVQANDETRERLIWKINKKLKKFSRMKWSGKIGRIRKRGGHTFFGLIVNEFVTVL